MFSDCCLQHPEEKRQTASHPGSFRRPSQPGVQLGFCPKVGDEFVTEMVEVFLWNDGKRRSKSYIFNLQMCVFECVRKPSIMEQHSNFHLKLLSGYYGSKIIIEQDQMSDFDIPNLFQTVNPSFLGPWTLPFKQTKRVCWCCPFLQMGYEPFIGSHGCCHLSRTYRSTKNITLP